MTMAAVDVLADQDEAPVMGLQRLALEEINLLGVYAFDGVEFLAGLRARYVEGRIYQRGANVPAEGEAARRAISAVSAWSEAVRLDWEGKQFSIAVDVELVASQRFDRAMANHGAGIVALLLLAFPATTIAQTTPSANMVSRVETHRSDVFDTTESHNAGGPCMIAFWKINSSAHSAKRK